MYIRLRCKPWRVGLLFAAALLPATLSLADGDTRARAVDLYDQSRYAEARPLLEQLDAAGEADGVLLYRLYYCQSLAGDPAARATLQRARERLEQEAPTSTTLEAPFYLANTYRNVAKLSEMREVAERAVLRVEQRELPEPSEPLDQFRLGKLYADLERVGPAITWYGRAVDSMVAAESERYAAYLQWAARYLADRHVEKEDFAKAQFYLELLLDSQPQASKQDLDRLAVMQLRAGEFSKAGQTWRRMAGLDPADADRARYCVHVTRMADELGELAELAADGRKWAELTKEELEQTLLEQATVVREAVAEAKAAEKLEPKLRNELQQRINAAAPLFVTAAVEYVARGYGLREHAFFGGYAPLVFRNRDWLLPPAD